MSEPILQDVLPLQPWLDPRTARLPGVLPLGAGDWLRVDEAYGAQMAERDRLISSRAEAVHALDDSARPAAVELLDAVLAELAVMPGFRHEAHGVVRPDGVTVAIDRDRPLLSLGRLVQEDFCLLERRGDEHVLAGAILCFPASWSLDEKFGRPLTGIHRTVRTYDPDIARRVQRLFDAVRAGQPLWRMNALVYVDPSLHQPGREGAPRTERTQGQFVRAERQSILRLPLSDAVVFSIHTYVVRLDSLTAEARDALMSARL